MHHLWGVACGREGAERAVPLENTPATCQGQGPPSTLCLVILGTEKSSKWDHPQVCWCPQGKENLPFRQGVNLSSSFWDEKQEEMDLLPNSSSFSYRAKKPNNNNNNNKNKSTILCWALSATESQQESDPPPADSPMTQLGRPPALPAVSHLSLGESGHCHFMRFLWKQVLMTPQSLKSLKSRGQNLLHADCYWGCDGAFSAECGSREGCSPDSHELLADICPLCIGNSGWPVSLFF